MLTCFTDYPKPVGQRRPHPLSNFRTGIGQFSLTVQRKVAHQGWLLLLRLNTGQRSGSGGIGEQRQNYQHRCVFIEWEVQLCPSVVATKLPASQTIFSYMKNVWIDNIAMCGGVRSSFNQYLHKEIISLGSNLPGNLHLEVRLRTQSQTSLLLIRTVPSLINYPIFEMWRSFKAAQRSQDRQKGFDQSSAVMKK